MYTVSSSVASMLKSKPKENVMSAVSVEVIYIFHIKTKLCWFL